MSSPADGRPRRRNWALWIGAAVLVAVVAFALGLALGRGRAPDDPPRAQGPGPARVEGGVPVGYAWTQVGAVTAAATYLQVLSRPENLEPSQAREVYSRFVLPDAVEEVLAARSLPEELRGMTGDPSFAFVVDPMGYRVEEFDPDQAVIEVWGVSVVTGPGELSALPRGQLQDAWAVARMVLRWVDDDWKVAALEDDPGPGPPDLAREIRRFEPFLHRPWPEEDGT